MKRLVSLIAVAGCGCATPNVDESSVQDDVQIGSVTAEQALGYSFAVADFDGDGIDDLAVGAPTFDWEPGSVFLYKGSANGLVPWRRIDEQDLSPPGGTTVDDGFGTQLAAGKIDDDGFAELVVAARGRGVVYVLEGSSAGPKTSGVQMIVGVSEPRALALHVEHPAFLAIGQPFTDDEGQVQVLQADLTKAPGHQFVPFATLKSPAPCSDCQFGASVAIVDLDGDGHRDIAIGQPEENVSIGHVYVFPGTGHSFTAPITVREESSQSRSAGDMFGHAMAVSRKGFDSDHVPELAILAPGFGGFGGLGRAFTYKPDVQGGVLTGMHVTQGFTLTGAIVDDELTGSIAVGDLNGDGFDDLVVGCPGAELNNNNGAGDLRVAMGAPDGPSGMSTLVWALGVSSTGELEFPGIYDTYGASVAMGDFAGDGLREIVAGMPGHEEHRNATTTEPRSGAFYEYSAASGGPVPFGVLFDEGSQ